MISHSDNTATDMALSHAGPDRVRQFIASLGLNQTMIPESTRQYIAYIAGDPQWQTADWSQLQTLLADDPYQHRPLLNDTITSASTPAELVAFYTRALHGEYFHYPGTLAVFRSILSTAEVIGTIMPLGVNAFLKSGSFAGTSENVQAIAGGLFTANRWVYYATLFSWRNEEWSPLPDVQPELFRLLKTAFTLVRDRLGS
jgi:beta-lactamase class A